MDKQLEKKALQEKIEALFVENGLSYREAMSVLDGLISLYMGKGRNYLNSATVQEVSKTPFLVK